MTFSDELADHNEKHRAPRLIRSDATTARQSVRIESTSMAAWKPPTAMMYLYVSHGSVPGFTRWMDTCSLVTLTAHSSQLTAHSQHSQQPAAALLISLGAVKRKQIPKTERKYYFCEVLYDILETLLILYKSIRYSVASLVKL